MMIRIRITLSCLMCVWVCVTANAQEDEDLYLPRTVYTMSEVLDAVELISLGVALDAPIILDFDRFDNSYLLPLINYLDFNVIGLGRSATLYPREMIDFILDQLRIGYTLVEIGQLLPDEYQRLELAVLQQQQEELTILQEERIRDESAEQQPPRVSVGGFFVTEFERRQEKDGRFVSLMDINQMRVFFSAQMNPSALKNRLSFLAEWNAIPEEVIHHIDQVIVRSDSLDPVTSTVIIDTIGLIQNPVKEDVPFQQLYIDVSNIGDSGFNLRFGQFRLPFGLWSDVTSHRNFSSAKNNTLVNGFALRKIEMGAILQKVYASGLDFQVGVVHGRQVRTTGLDRQDIDRHKDLITRWAFAPGGAQIGFSAYFGEFKLDRNYAYGFDFVLRSRYLMLSTEYVVQKNNDMPATYRKSLQFTKGKARSIYFQFDAALSPKLHLYGFYETWRLFLDGKRINNPANKVFHGVRYAFSPNFRWTVFEYGRMYHNAFDDGEIHAGSQIELTF